MKHHRSRTSEQRHRDLVTLSAEMGHTLPPITYPVGVYVIVVEGRQELLAEAFEYVAAGTPVAAVGVANPHVQPFLCRGEGTDVQKMSWVADWIAGERFAGPVVMYVPPHRAWLLNGLLQQALWLRGIDCKSQAMDTPQEHGVDLESALEQARLLVQALDNGDIDRIPELEPNSLLRQTYERLITA